VFEPGELGERRFRREAQEVFGGSGAPFLLVAFLWVNKEKRPAVGQPPTSYTSPKATQMKSRPWGGFVIQTLDSRFRGNDYDGI
jgi:hypothetical protein